MQSKFDENYKDCLIKSNFLLAIAHNCDKDKPIEEIKMEVNKSNNISFDELAHSSSEFVMDIFSNNKFKFFLMEEEIKE
jgi:hypothetical protein